MFSNLFQLIFEFFFGKCAIFDSDFTNSFPSAPVSVSEVDFRYVHSLQRKNRHWGLDVISKQKQFPQNNKSKDFSFHFNSWKYSERQWFDARVLRVCYTCKILPKLSNNVLQDHPRNFRFSFKNSYQDVSPRLLQV